MDSKLLLKELCLKNAPSGYEDNLFGVIKTEFSSFGDIAIDGMKNVYVHKKGKGKCKVVLMAHADEVSLIVTSIEDRGFLTFKPIGIDAKTLISQEVIVHGKQDISGIIGIKPPHLMNQKERTEAIPADKLLIDTGYSTEKLKEIVSVGDYVTIKRDFYELFNNSVTCKAIDNRASIAAMYVCAQELQNVAHDVEVYFVCSAQEEVGHRGAKMAAYNLNPDICIAIDVTFDGGKLGDTDRENEIGGGPVICIGPNIHGKVMEKIIDTANSYGIKYKVEVEPGNTGCDAWDTQISRSGVPSVLVSIPIKYMHTSVELVSVDDINNTGILISKFIQELNSIDVEELLCF
ncbi:MULTISPECIES: zinc-binding metallopeptidase family protein [Clostridium]|uniref:M42 family peptidase n=1 Tax=Clostridium TaxID=1485 RepID=UPI00069D779B|nr:MULTISPECIES: M42 family peptidase [Clostridium]KOF57386.1 aminopeptidase [Clostridium sp. DMHC 10]MCD2348772.1 M42 family peptidase [Clostridium guangxiense]